MLRHSNIFFTKNTVIKRGDPSLMCVEVEKTKRAYQIGKDCGLFRVPEVLDYNEKKGEAVFRRIDGAIPICHKLPRGKEYVNFSERLGASLATIHQNLTLPTDMILPLPQDFAADIGQDVFLHGDLSLNNICTINDTFSIVILDWQMTPVHGGKATFGCRYFDILWFVNNLIWIPTIFHLIGDPVFPIARRFLESYFFTSKTTYKAESIARYAEHFFSKKISFRPNTSLKQKYIKYRCDALTKRFIGSLKRDIGNEQLHIY